MQSEFEGIVYIEQLMERTADTFWSLAGALQEVDSSLNNLVDAALRVPSHQERWEGFHENSSFNNALDELRDSDRTYRGHMETLATMVLLILRDPLSAKCWSLMDDRVGPLLPSEKHPRSFARLARGALVTQNDPASLSQSIRRSLSVNQIYSSNDPSFAIRLVAANERARSFIRDPQTGVFEKRVVRSKQHTQSRPALATQSSQLTVTKTIEELILERYDNLQRKFDNPVFRLLCAGAMLQTVQYNDRDTGAGVAYNSGAEMLVSVINRIPDNDAQALAFKAYLDENFDLSEQNQAKTIRYLTDKNIAGYLLPGLRLASKTISENPELLFMWASSPDPLNGHEGAK
ncbi:hypothetical protein RTM1035_11290 [Roseovarius sp. TM1035]|nr:hypothetical protein RTM1035_11290 [Roseovarius sp. TM1035]